MDRRNPDTQRNQQRSQQHQHRCRYEYASAATEAEHCSASGGARGDGGLHLTCAFKEVSRF